MVPRRPIRRAWFMGGTDMPRKRTASRGRSRSRQRGSLAEPRPIPGPDAFRDLRERNHVRSQAATLLLIGSHLRGDALATQARAEAARSLVRSGVPGAVQPLPDEDVRALGFPGLPAGTPRFRPEELQQVLESTWIGGSARSPRRETSLGRPALPRVSRPGPDRVGGPALAGACGRSSPPYPSPRRRR